MAINEIEHCEHTEVHAETVRAVREHMPAEDELYDLAELFKVFGDSTRIRILFALFEADICVCDIAELLEMTQSAISHQLRILKNAKLVKNRREGKLFDCAEKGKGGWLSRLLPRLSQAFSRSGRYLRLQRQQPQ